MKKFIFLILFLTTSMILAQTAGQKIKVQQLNPQADLSTLKKDYQVQELKDLPTHKSFSVSKEQRDYYFALAKMTKDLASFDQLDKDLIFNITRSKGVNACIKRYPQLASIKPKLKNLYKLIKKKK